MLSQQTIAMAGCFDPTTNGSTRFTESNKLRNNELRFGNLEAFSVKLQCCVKMCKSMNITYACAYPAFYHSIFEWIAMAQVLQILLCFPGSVGDCILFFQTPLGWAAVFKTSVG